MTEKKRILVFLAALLVIAQFAYASDAVIAYRSGSGSGASFPKIKFWNSSGSGSWGSEIELPTAGSPVREAVIKASNISTKLVLVTQSDDGNLDAYVCLADCANASNWVTTNNIGNVWTSAPAIHSRRFDVEFETASGRAMVVYSINSSNTSRDLAYQILPATTTSFTGLTEQYIDDSSGNGGSDLQYSWVSLDRKPTGNEIIAAGFDDTGSDINAWVWNGTAWGNQQELTAAATSTNGLEALAVKYAADGAKGMVIGGTGTTGSVNGQFWNSTAWTTANLGDVNGVGDNADIVWLTLKADPATDDLQAAGVEDDDDLDAYYWNGSTWAITQGIDATIDSSTTRPADFDWNPTGSTGSLVWDTDGAGTNLSTRTCSPQCTNATSTFSAYTGTGAWLALYRNPTSTDTVKILGARMNSSAALGSFSRNSTNFTNYGSANISANATSTAFESFTIAFQLSNASPGVSTCQNITSAGQYVQIANLVGAPIPTTSVVANACIRIASSNVTYDCNGFNITNNGTGGSTFGIVLNGPGITNITVRNCPGISQYSHGFYVHFTNNSLVSNVTSFNNSLVGLTAVGSNNITFTNDTAQNTTSGIDFSATRNSTISNNRVFSISGTGISLSANSSGNNVTGNNASNISSQGFEVNNATNNLLSGNLATNTTVGFLLDFSSSGNTLSQNNASGNSYGFYLGTCSNNALAGNAAFNNTQNGIILSNCSGTNLTGNSAFNNSAGGINLTSSNGVRMAGDHLYNNGMDFYVSASGESYNMSGEIFDNPAGTFASYTNLSINDSVASAYYINWSGNATVTPLPAGHISFGQKFVNITNLTPGVSIDRLVWNWLDSEPGAANETKFELWEYDSGGWASRNATPNTAANTLSLSNESTFSVFALLVSFDTTPPVVTLNSPANNSLVNISPVNFNFTTVDNQSAVMNCSLFIDGVLNATNSSTLNNTPTIFPVSGITVGSHTWNVTCRDASNNTGASQTFTFFNTAVSSCPVITSNGTYNQVANLVGGSNSVSPPSIGGGFSTVCVKIAASNVTYNCNNFNITNDGTANRIGVFLNSSLKNVSLLNCGVNGYKVDVYVLGTNNSLFMNNSIRNASQDGIFVDSSFNSTFTGNDIFNNSQSGVDASASAGHLFANNTLRNNSQHGIQITSSPNNTFINNTAADNANDGIHVASSDNNLFENNTLFLNKQDGIQVVTNANNTFRNNRANNNSQHGLHIVGTSNNTFINNSMAFNSQSGFLSASSVNSSFVNNTAHDNGQNGFDFASSDMDSMTNNTAYNNPQNGILLDDSNRTTHFMNHFYNNTADLRMIAIPNRIINTTYDIYDRPTDAFGNFTNLSINDAAAGSTFTVTWSPQPATPPSGCPAFAALTTGSKFVNITNVSGSVTIDSIAWSWTAAESAPYNESMFRLARYN
ncbi:MAG: NosD domain-containing protein, partial [Candidatus Micrarchaeia archaeon]